LKSKETSGASQATDEGSIPFTRSIPAFCFVPATLLTDSGPALAALLCLSVEETTFPTITNAQFDVVAILADAL